MNFIVFNSFNGDIVLMGSEDFCNEYRHEFPYPDYKMMEEEMYDDYICILQDQMENICYE